MSNTTIKINQIPVEQVSTTKSLGVHIDHNLNWDFHVKENSKKMASGISAIKRIRNFVPQEILLTIYNSLIHPHFEYCSVVWGCCSRGLSEITKVTEPCRTYHNLLKLMIIIKNNIIIIIRTFPECFAPEKFQCKIT